MEKTETRDIDSEAELLICGLFDGIQSERAHRGGQANHHQH